MVIPPLFIDVAILVLLSILGFLTVRIVSPRAGTVAALAAAFPLGAGSSSFLVFLASWAGLRIDLTTVGALELFLGLLFLAAWRLTHRSQPDNRAILPGRRPADTFQRLIPWAIIGVAIAASAVISVGRSHTPFDSSAIWASKAYGIAEEGTVFAGNSWGAHGLTYPLNIPLLISIFQLADGDALPGSKLLFPFYFGSILMAAVAFWRRTGMSSAWVSVGVLILATIPEVFRHSTYGYVNVPASAYLSVGTLWSVEGLIESSRGKMAVAGMLLGLGCWTRVEGPFFAVAICAALVVAWWLQARPRPVPWLPLVMPIVAIGGSWFLFFRTYSLGGSQAARAVSQALAGWMDGELHLHEIRLLLGYFRRELLDAQTWGLLFPVSAAVLILYRRRLFDRSRPEAFPLALATLASGLATGGLFYVGSYARGDLVAWLTRGFPRAFLPAAILLVVLTFLVAAPEGAPRESPPAKDRIGSAGSLC